jgi:hypothetical protein
MALTKEEKHAVLEERAKHTRNDLADSTTMRDSFAAEVERLAYELSVIEAAIELEG